MNFDNYFDEFTKELNSIEDFRLQVLFLHLHLEYWINKIIEKSFVKPEEIFKNRDLRTFYNKLCIIDSLSLLHPKAIEKIKIVNEIRNHYSHNIVGKEEFPKKIIDNIQNLMKDSPVKEEINKYGVNLVHQFVIQCTGMIISLEEIYETTSKITDNKIFSKTNQ